MHPAVRATKAAQTALDHAPAGTKVEVAPALDPAIVDLQAPAGLATDRAHPPPATQAHGHDHPLGGE
jgi:hypothetical protein